MFDLVTLYRIFNECCLNIKSLCLYPRSAGIGRTGTYIAIDELGKTLQKSRKINIAEYVKKMRENRMNMVQTYVNDYICFVRLCPYYKTGCIKIYA